MTENLKSLLVDFRESVHARFVRPPVELVTGTAPQRPGRVSRGRAVLGLVAVAAAVVAIIVVPVVVVGEGERPTPPGGRPVHGPEASAPAPDPWVSAPAPQNPAMPPEGRIDLQTFRTRLPEIVEPGRTGAPACPGGDIVFHSDGMNAAAGGIGTTRYTIGGHPTMPDHLMSAVEADIDGDGVSEVVTTIACEPRHGRRTVNLYVLRRTADGYTVLDVPVSDNRRFDRPRPILHSFGVTGGALGVTLDDLDAQPVEPSRASWDDGRPDNPRDVVLQWNGQTFQPRVGDYRW